MFFSNPFCNLSKSRSWQRYFPDFTPKWYPKGYPRIASKSLENRPSKNNDFHTPPVDCKSLPPDHPAPPPSTPPSHCIQDAGLTSKHAKTCFPESAALCLPQLLRRVESLMQSHPPAHPLYNFLHTSCEAVAKATS